MSEPLSPHIAAKNDQILIGKEDLPVPEIEDNLIIEGAGGLMVPVNEEGDLFVDLFHSWRLPVIVVSMHYLGSINHTLLTIEALKSRNIPIEGIVFVGDENLATESIILNNSNIRMIHRVPLVEKITGAFIQEQAHQIVIANVFGIK